jgi:acyl carrier protein phosphodiesterase
MNYLAHAYLGDRDAEFMLGSLIGDFVKGTPGPPYSPGVIDGIFFHRRIDTYADHHRATLASRNLFSEPLRRYAGIILDICYDHFLSKNWDRYSSEDLSDFIHRTYRLLLNHRSILPPRLASILPRMLDQDWLACYRSLKGVDLTLKRMSKRLRNPDGFNGAAGEISRHYPLLEKNFFDFFPDLVQYSRSLSDA